MSRRRDGSDAINGGRDGMSSRENSLDSGAPSTATPIPAYSERRPRIDGRSTSSRNGRWGHDADGRQDSTSSVPQMSSRTGGSMSSSNQQVEDLWRSIVQQWPFMTTDSCTPIKVALQLMDSSSLGLAERLNDFKATHKQLQSALKKIVNEHHQGFNSSIGTFHQIQASLHTSQHRVRELKASLVDAKQSMDTSRPELKVFASSSSNYDQMLQLLSLIDDLQAMPQKIESQVSEKRFLGAVDSLQEALKMTRRPELDGIGALSDLKVYLSNQEHSVSDILIEELHNHLYLKSAYCEDRWRPYLTRPSQTTAVVAGTDRDQLFRFLNLLDSPQALRDDQIRNPEADSFYYLRLIIEALGRMSQLDVAVDSIEQRMPVEIFKVVEKCYSEVEQQHPKATRKIGARKSDRLVDWQEDESRRDVVEYVLSSLFARFEAIAEAHRVIYDVIDSITRKKGERDPMLLRSFNELWKLYQSEIRSLLHDHLSSSNNLDARAGTEGNLAMNMFRPYTRDKTKRLFKLANSSQDSENIARERDALDTILKSTVPGLMAGGLAQATREEDNNKSAGMSATGHKLLVEPSVFNMSTLLMPSLSFLTRLRDIVPPNSDVIVSTLTSFLDDFLVNVFEPQLEETLVDSCTMAYSRTNAFHEDPDWQSHAARPIFRSTFELFTLLQTVCRMLMTLPPKPSFAELLLVQIRANYDRVNDVFRNIAAKAQLDAASPKLRKKAVALAENGDLMTAVKQIIEASDSVQAQDMSACNSLIMFVNRNATSATEDFFEPKTIRQLILIYSSCLWLVNQLKTLKRVDDKAAAANTTTLAVYQAQQWSDVSDQQQPYLSLTSETANGFDNFLMAYSDLASLILRSLYIEYRLQALSGVARLFTCLYQLDQAHTTPDAVVLSIVEAMSAFNTDLRNRLPKTEYHIIVHNLDTLLDIALIEFGHHIKAMDQFGSEKLILNILVLQQGLKEMDESASLSRSMAYWQMYGQHPAAILEGYHAGLMSRHEATVLINLSYDLNDLTDDAMKMEVKEALHELSIATPVEQQHGQY